MHKKYLNKNHTYTLFKEIKPPLEIMQAHGSYRNTMKTLIAEGPG